MQRKGQCGRMKRLVKDSNICLVMAVLTRLGALDPSVSPRLNPWQYWG